MSLNVTQLIDAVFSNNVHEACKHLMDGVNVNCYEDDAMVTPLHHSVAANNHHMTLLLLNFGANPLLSDSDGQSAFQMSVHSSDDTIVRMIGYFLSTQPPAL